MYISKIISEYVLIFLWVYLIITFLFSFPSDLLNYPPESNPNSENKYSSPKTLSSSKKLESGPNHTLTQPIHPEMTTSSSAHLLYAHSEQASQKLPSNNFGNCFILL